MNEFVLFGLLMVVYGVVFVREKPQFEVMNP